MRIICLAALLCMSAPAAAQNLAVRAKLLYTCSGPAIPDGVVVIREGKITAVGPASSTPVPQGFKVVQAAIATPGLVDVRATVGLTGILNMQGADQDQLDTGSPMQPELRAIDAYNPKDPLVGYVRSFGVTTVNTGHSPGALISGQTAVLKTADAPVDRTLMKDGAFVTADLSRGGTSSSRAKAFANLRALLIRVQEAIAAGEPKSRNLQTEVLAKVLRRETPLCITVHKAQDIANALRLQREFRFTLVLSEATEAPLMLREIKEAGVSIALHPSMQRPGGEAEASSFETAVTLRRAGIPFAIQTGYEGYVPKVRVLLFEAAIAAANGLSPQEALNAVTISAARMLGVDQRVGSLEVGKDGDIALFDGDPFEYTSHCVGTIIEGKQVSTEVR
jgi:imidazolonepropionase-like amidohydrolase